ncbi:MAG: TlpA family protein disulfide reductase [Deltaproteobacteria bacterium]|nr:TlpA family protein disulfide reductase [Deltaproteobacteria bacterium]
MEIEVRSQKQEARSKKSEAKERRFKVQGSRVKIRKLATCNLKLATFILLFTVVTGCVQKNEEGDIRKTLPKEGDIAVSFSLKLLDGKRFSLNDTKGKPVIINFFASWCHPCRLEAPALQRVYAQYKDKGVVFIGVAVQDTETKVKAYGKEFGISFPIGLDNEGSISELYKIYGIPKTFIIGKDGRFSYIHTGEITEVDLINEIEKVLK